MTVADLIKFLSTQQQDLPVAIKMYSEQCLLETHDIKVEDLCKPRRDGWIPNKRPDRSTQKYLVFPGN